MSDASVPSRLGAVRSVLGRPGVSIVVLAIGAELALLAGYVGVQGVTVTSVRYLLYPFVWIDLALWGVFAFDLPGGVSRRARRLALVVAVGYFAVLASAGGLVQTSLFGGHVHSAGFDVTVFTAGPPGYAPTLVVESTTVTLQLVLFKLVGYVGLTYLTYVAVVDTAASALSGAIGVLSCVSCSWPVFASLLAAVLGGEVVGEALYAYSLDLSTVAFVLAIALLAWRPGGT